MASLDLVLVEDVPLEPEKSSATVQIVGALPTGSTTSAPVLRCVRRKASGKAVYGVWTREKGFRTPRVADEKALRGVASACADGRATGLFTLASSSSKRGELGFTYLEHDPSNPTKVSHMRRVSPKDILRSCAEEGDTANALAVAASVMRCDTPRGPVVAALITARRGEGSVGGKTALLVGSLDSGEWKQWELGPLEAGASVPTAVSIRPEGDAVLLLDCTVQAAGTGAGLISLPAEDALRVFVRAGDAPMETMATGAARDYCPPPQSPVRARVHERLVPLVGTGGPVVHRFFESKAFRPLAPITTVVACPVALEDVSGGGGSSGPSLVYRVQLPAQLSPLDAQSLLFLTPTHAEAALAGTCLTLPAADGPHALAVARLPSGSGLVPSRPSDVYVGLALASRDVSLSAWELFGNVGAVAVTIGGNSSLGLPHNQVALRRGDAASPRSPGRRLSTAAAAATLARVFGRSRSPSAAAAGAAPAEGGYARAGVSLQLCGLLSDSTRTPMTLLCANGKYAAALRVEKASLLPLAVDVSTPGAAADGRLRAGEELRYAVEKLRQAAGAALGGAERRAAVEAALQRVLPALLHVGSAQKDVYLVQQTLATLLEVYRPETRADWQYLWAAVTAMQASLERRVGGDGALFYADRFFVGMAQQYCQGLGGRGADLPDDLRCMLESLPQVVSNDLKQLAARPTQTDTPVAAFILDALASGAALVPLAEEVALRCVECAILSNGACAVRPKAEAGPCVYLAGILLLASCLDVDVAVARDEGGGLRCICEAGSGAQLPGEAAGTPRRQQQPLVRAPVQGFTSQLEFEHALVLACDLLAVPPGAGVVLGEAQPSPSKGQPTSPAGHSVYYARASVALLALSVSRRVHALCAYVQLHAPLLRAAVAECAAGGALSDNTGWLQACTDALGRSHDAELRRLLNIDEHRTTRALDVAVALGYVISGGGAGVDHRLYRSLKVVVPEEVCVSSVVAYLFHSTEKLVAAHNNYSAAVAKQMLAAGPQDHGAATAAAVTECTERLQQVLGRVLRAWGEVQPLLPYPLPDIVASYAAEVTASRRAASPSEAGPAPSGGTVASRTLVMCFRLLLLVWHTHQLVQRMDRATELCRKADAAGDELAEFHPSVGGSLQALYVLHTLSGDGVPTDGLSANLLTMVETVLPRLTQRRSAAWAPFFAHVLQLSRIGETSLASLKARYYALLDALQAAAPTSASEDGAHASARTYIAKADHLVRSLTVQSEPSVAGGGRSQGARPLFTLSQHRDATLPRWAANHSLSARQFLVESEWSERLWGMEGRPEPLRDATDTLTARLLAERERAEARQLRVETDAHYGGLPPRLQRPLFAEVCALVPPVRTHSVVDHSSLPSHGVIAQPVHAPVRTPAPVIAAADPPTPTPAPVPPPPRSSQQEAAAPPAAAEEAPSRSQVAPVSPVVPPAAPPPPAAAVVMAPTSEPPQRRPAGDAQVSAPAPGPLPTPQASDRPQPPAAQAEEWAGFLDSDFSAAAVAWWESTPAGAVSAPAGRVTATASGKALQDTSQNSSGDPVALSDTGTSYTTATSHSTADGIDAGVAARGAARGCGRGGSTGSLGCDHHAPAHHQRQRERPVGDRRRGHCTCRRHRERHHHSRRAVGYTDPDSLLVLRHDGSRVSPAATQSSEARGLRSDQRIQLLQFTSALRPGSNAGVSEAAGRSPATARGSQRVPTERFAAQDSNGEVALLTLGGGSGRRVTHRPHVRLFGPLPDGDGGAAALDPNAPLPLSATARASVRYLEPPPLPSASVFQAPPPLLRLPSRGAGRELMGGAAALPEGSPLPAPPLGQAGASSAAPQWTDGASPYAQVPRDAPSPPVAAAGPPPVGTPSAPPTHTAAPELTRPILTASELDDFHRYTAELKSRGVAAFIPVPVALPGTGAPPPPVPTAVQSPLPGPHPTSPGYTSLLEQHNTFLKRVDDALRRQDTQNAEFHQRLLDGLRGPASARGPGPALAQPLVVPGGLSAVEQARLVQNTIHQKNELMNMNHQLLDLQLQAARGATQYAPTPTPVSPQATLTFLSSRETAMGPGVPAPATAPRTATVPPPLSPAPAPAPASGGAANLSALITGTAATQTEVPASRDAAANAESGPPSAPPRDPRAERSVAATMDELRRLNSGLLSMNASADAMERAVLETQRAIAQYESCRSLDASNAEGAALLSSLRHRTAAAEERLAEVARLAAAAQPAPMQWSSSPQRQRQLQLLDSVHAGGQEVRAEWEQTPQARGEGALRQPSPAGERVPQTPPLSEPSRTHAQGPPPLTRGAPPAPPRPLSPPRQHRHSGPLSLAARPAAAPATFLSVSSSPAGQRQPTPPPPPRRTTSAAAAAAPAPWDPSQRPTRTAPTAERPRRARGRSPFLSQASHRGSLPFGVGGERSPSPPAQAPPADLRQLYAGGQRRSLAVPERSRSRQSSVGPDRFAMYRASLASQRPSGAAAVQPLPKRTSAPLREMPRPQPLTQSTSHRFEARQRDRRSESVARRMAQLEADLFP